MERYRVLIVLFVIVAFIGCSGSNTPDPTSNGSNLNSPPADDEHFPFTTQVDDRSVAHETLPTHVASTPLKLEDIQEHPEFGEIANNELILNFSITATVLDIRNLLDEFELVFKSTIEGSGVVTVTLNERKTNEQITLLIDEIENKDFVDFVIPSYVISINSLPIGLKTSDVGGSHSFIDHHLAVNAHAAWNLQAARQSRYVPPVRVIVTDDFDDDHGFMVEGIISNGFSTVTSNVKGMYPEGLVVDRIQMEYVYDFNENKLKSKLGETINKTLEIILDDEYHRPIIVNASWGGGYLPKNTPDQNIVKANEAAISYLRLVRKLENLFVPGSGIEDKFLLVAATGNIVSQNIETRSEVDPPFGAARLLDLTYNGNQVPNATNIVVVENFMYGLAYDGSDIKPVVACMSETSFSPEDKSKYGHIGAIGTNVYSYKKDFIGGDYSIGTSFAAPQVSGLAAIIWDTSPTLLPHEVIDVLIKNSQVIQEETVYSSQLGPLNGGQVVDFDGEGCKQGIGENKAIDAYRSLLSLDHASSLDEGGDLMEARVRLSALDGDIEQQTKDMIFNENDIQEFLNELTVRNGSLDYSKYDLNGDARTGGDSTDKFDLNIDGKYELYISEVTHEYYDELNLTDFEILCFYAFSNIYSGDKEQRDFLLPECITEWSAEWYAADVEPRFVNHTMENNHLLNPPIAVSIENNKILNSAVFTDHQNGNLKLEFITPLSSEANINISFGTPSEQSFHIRIQYCLSPDTFIECWEGVSGAATIEESQGKITVIFNNALFEMYFDSDGAWLSINEIEANGLQVVDSTRTRQQAFTGRISFLLAEPVPSDNPLNCDSIPKLLINPFVEASMIVTAEPPANLPSNSNPLACIDSIPNNTPIDVISGPYSDSLMGDTSPWHEIQVDNLSAYCPGVSGYALASNISFASQICDGSDALLVTPASTGILAIMDMPSLFSGQRVCTSFSNSSVVLGGITNDDIITNLQWRNVEILNGPCKGISGFVDETVVSQH